eukprot:3768766-Rhodomonas_salina.1
MEPVSTVTAGIMDASCDLERGFSGISVGAREVAIDTGKEKAANSPDTISEDFRLPTHDSATASPDDFTESPHTCDPLEDNPAINHSPMPSTPSASVLEYVMASNRRLFQLCALPITCFR